VCWNAFYTPVNRIKEINIQRAFAFFSGRFNQVASSDCREKAVENNAGSDLSEFVKAAEELRRK